MRIAAELSVVPISGDPSLADYITACERILDEAGLPTELHAFGTDVEGDWDTVMDALRRCHEVVHEMGAVKILSNVKILTRTDHEPNLADPVARVRERLQGDG